MFEVAHSGESHSDAGFVAGGNNFVVADGSTRLNDKLCAHFARGINAVGKREEGFGNEYALADDLLNFVFGDFRFLRL